MKYERIYVQIDVRNAMPRIKVYGFILRNGINPTHETFFSLIDFTEFLNENLKTDGEIITKLIR
jgi:hypothetical protein